MPFHDDNFEWQCYRLSIEKPHRSLSIICMGIYQGVTSLTFCEPVIDRFGDADLFAIYNISIGRKTFWRERFKSEIHGDH